MPLWIRLARRYSLHAVWLAGMVAAVAAFIWAFALDGPQLAAFAVICVLSGLAFGADLALPPALLARVIDANGHAGQREGAYFGLWNFVNKLTLALAGGIALPLLEGLGYTRGAATPRRSPRLPSSTPWCLRAQAHRCRPAARCVAPARF